MNYAELKKAYEESIQKCSELEKEIEDKDFRIEHLTELLIKRKRTVPAFYAETVLQTILCSFSYKFSYIHALYLS